MEFVVIASWISYWVPYDSIPGRMSPIVTVLLAIINGLIGISGDFTPGESCISMLEIYIIGALFQVYYLIDGIFYICNRRTIRYGHISFEPRSENFRKKI